VFSKLLPIYIVRITDKGFGVRSSRVQEQILIGSVNGLKLKFNF